MNDAQALRIGFEAPARRRASGAQQVRGRSTVTKMADPAAAAEPDLLVEEARLARAAANGDGDAFATLYERYARRAYNLALRLGGSEADAADAVQEAFLSVMKRLPQLSDRDLAFGSYLLTATRNATYDLIRHQQRSRPSDAIPESAVPLGAGAGGLGLDPGDPEEDPDRGVLLAAQREEIREANARLPERQREALALRELEGLSYDEIAAALEMNRNSVAQLISRARINLRDELRGTALASVATSSTECERALPLIAARDDGQLDPESGDAAWLNAHLSSCDTCHVATEAMREAGVSYRAWAPVAIAPALFRETMARAAGLTGSDWSEVTERRLARPTPTGDLPGLPAAYRGGEGGVGRKRRRKAMLAVLAVLLLAAGLAAALAGELDDATAPDPMPAAAKPAEIVGLGPAMKVKEPQRQPKPGATAEPGAVEGPEPTAAPVAETVPEPSPEPSGSKSESRTGPASEPAGEVAPPQSVGSEPKAEAEPEPVPQPEPSPESTPPTEPPPSEPPPTRPPRGPPTITSPNSPNGS